MPRWSKDAAAAFARVRHRDPEQVYRLALALIVLAGAALRLHGLGSLPLNYDEGATLYFAHLPFADLWGKPAWLETNPPLFYMIAHLMVRWFGDAAGGASPGGRPWPGAFAFPWRLGSLVASVAAGLGLWQLHWWRARP